MDTIRLAIPGLHIGISLLSALGLYNSYISITNLQQYEEKSEKAAKYSGTAEHQLYKTRTTQASAALSILASFLASSSLLLFSSRSSYTTRAIVSAAASVTSLFAHEHVRGFWKAKAKVPFVDGYNEAIGKTESLMVTMRRLGYAWVGTLVVGVVLW